MTGQPTVGAVVIGRNEGDRLVRCLASATEQADRVVYVDSGSTDGSQQAAKAVGATCVELDQSQPFTAARARNAGFDILQKDPVPVQFVQFIDGDCELQPSWIEAARSFLAETPTAAVACGRRRERFPEASVYNRLIDQEWDTPVGQTRACGGDALMRSKALSAVGGFDPALIAGEEPELCVRLRAAGWSIWRLDEEMTLHDAALTRFAQWWNRNRRAGHAYGEGAAMHGSPPERHCVRETRSALAWGAVFPLLVVTGTLVTSWSLALLLVWPAQVLRLVSRGMDPTRALFITLGKIPEAQGIIGYWWGRFRKRQAALIEYK